MQMLYDGCTAGGLHNHWPHRMHSGHSKQLLGPVLLLDGHERWEACAFMLVRQVGGPHPSGWDGEAAMTCLALSSSGQAQKRGISDLGLVCWVMGADLGPPYRSRRTIVWKLPVHGLVT